MVLLQNIALQYGDRHLFRNLNLTLRDKEKIGLIGRNGAGKSTLFKIISDEISADEGTVSFPKNFNIGVLSQTLTIREDVEILEETMTAFAELLKDQARLEKLNESLITREDYESDDYMKLVQEISDLTEKLQILDPANTEASAIKVLMGLGFKQSDLKRSINELSGGWKMRVELAKLLLRSPELLMLDEPTNHLDIESIIWLESYLNNYPGIVLVISHDTRFLDEVTNRTIEIELGKINSFKGNYSKYIFEKAKMKEINEAAHENQQKQIAHKEQLIEKFRAKANKAKFAQSLIKELNRLERVELGHENTQEMKLEFPPAPRAGRLLYDIKALSKSYGEKNVLKNVDLQIERGDKIAFVGQNGQGKTTLAKIIAQTLNPSSGELNEGHNMKIGFFAQDQAEQLNGKITILDTLYDVIPEDMRTKARKILGGFLFSGEDVDKKVSVLSGGEKTRLSLACMITKEMNLLILDEPTNHLDINAKAVLSEALERYDGTMVVVSHDRDFLSGLTNKTYEFKEGKIHLHHGDVNSFLASRAAEDFRQIELKTKEKAIDKNEAEETSKPISSLDREQTKKLQRRIQYLERDIDKLEKKITEVEMKMSDPEFFQSENHQSEIEAYKKLKSELADKTDEWEKAVEEMD